MNSRVDHDDGSAAAERSVQGAPSLGFELPDDAWVQVVGDYCRDENLGVFGEYRLIAEIGRGGQGVVYRAVQARTDRTVAIKKLSAGVFATPEMRNRFRREVEAAAALDHPGIVTVFSSEVIHGLPVLTMQWIDGCHVDRWAWCSAPDSITTPRTPTASATMATAGADRDRRRLRSPREVLGLFDRICDAVHHAHQRGVIHRDLKPSNILVDESGLPHILDFGLAKFDRRDGESALLTNTGQALGTLYYSAPEQLAGGRTDVRSDVYSLGIVLYVTLTGKTPFPAPLNLADASRLCTAEVPAPSRERPELNEEIDAIVMKAAAAYPELRYASVDAFQADLRRYLNGEPVAAHLPTRVYRIRKFVQKHRRAVVLAGAVGVVLSGAAIISSTLYWKSESNRQAAEQARADEAEQRGTAEVVSAFLREVLTLADPNRTRGARLTVPEMLAEAVRRIDTGDLAARPHAEADVRAAIGVTYVSLGLFQDAETQLRRAAAIQGRLLGPAQPTTLKTQSVIVDSLLWQAKYTDAVDLGRRTLANQRRALGSMHPDSLRTQVLLGRSLAFSGGLPEAEQLLRDGADALQQVRGAEHEETADALDSLGMVLALGRRFAEAEPLHERAYAIHRRALGENHPSTLYSVNFLASARAAIGKSAEAQALFESSYVRALKVLGPDHLATMALRTNLADSLQAQGNHLEALHLLEEMTESHARVLGAAHAHTLMVQHSLVRTLIALERHSDAEALARRALEIAEDAYGPDHNDTVLQFVEDLSTIYDFQQRFVEAEAALRRLMEARRRTLGPADPQTIESVDKLAKLLRHVGRAEEAAALGRLSRAIGETTVPMGPDTDREHRP